jgi:fluoride exporter
MMDKYLLVGTGGFIGAVLRYWVSGAIQQLSKSNLFPFGTLAVNFLGCLVIGFLSQLAEEHGAFTVETRTLMFVGVLGGFTTFSTFGNETMNLLRDSQNYLAFGNVAGHLILGIGAVWLGRTLAYVIWR